MKIDRNALVFLVIFLILPLLTTIFFYSNTEIELKMNLQNPELWQFFTYAFMHENSDHYLNNLTSYIIIFPLCAFTALKAGREKLFLKLWLLILFTAPAITILFELITRYAFGIPGLFTSGSSGLCAAILGFIPSFYLFYLLHNGADKKEGYFLTTLLITLFIVLLPTSGIQKSLLPFAFALILLFFHRKTFINLGKTQATLLKKDHFTNAIPVMAVLVYFLGIWNLFPPNLITTTSIINTLGHYLGFLFGFLTSWIALKTIPEVRGLLINLLMHNNHH